MAEWRPRLDAGRNPHVLKRLATSAVGHLNPARCGGPKRSPKVAENENTTLWDCALRYVFFLARSINTFGGRLM